MNEKIMLNYDAATINKAIELALKQGTGTGGADSGTAVRRLDNYFKQSGYAMFKYKAYNGDNATGDHSYLSEIDSGSSPELNSNSKLGWIVSDKAFDDNVLPSTTKHFDKYEKCNFIFGNFANCSDKNFGRIIIKQPGIYKVRICTKGSFSANTNGSTTYKNVRFVIAVICNDNGNDNVIEIPIENALSSCDISSEGVNITIDGVNEFVIDLSENTLNSYYNDDYCHYAHIIPCLFTDSDHHIAYGYDGILYVTQFPSITIEIEPVAYEIPCDINCEYTLTSSRTLQINLKSGLYDYATDCAIVSAGIIYSYDCTSIVEARAELTFDDKGSDYKMKTYSYSATTTVTNTTETDEQFTLSIPTDESKLWATGFAQIRYNDGDSTKTRTRVVYTEPFKVEVV